MKSNFLPQQEAAFKQAFAESAAERAALQAGAKSAPIRHSTRSGPKWAFGENSGIECPPNYVRCMWCQGPNYTDGRYCCDGCALAEDGY